jgi:aristolochene synthase
MGLRMTPQELSLVKSAEENCMKHITLANDICSYSKEVLAAKDGFELGAICSSVPIIVNMCGLGEMGAYRVMWEMTRQLEIRHFELANRVLKDCDTDALRLYLKGLEYQMAGNERWSLLTPRYNYNGKVRFTEGR